MTRNVAVYLYDEVEVLDFAGPFEVFNTATRMAQRLAPQDSPLFQVFTLADRSRPVHARGNLLVQPHHTFKDHPPVDVLLVPGGVVTAELERSEVAQWIGHVARQCELIAAVCTGSFLLAQAGLLDGLEATTHWEDLDDLQARFPRVRVCSDRRWVDTGAIVTSAGISAGIDMSLHLVEKLAGRDLAVRTARQMDYAWQEDQHDH